MTRRALSRGLAGYRWLVAAIAIAALALSVTAANGASTITVTTTAQVIADDGACSLQEAILAANYDATVVPNPGDPTDQHDTGCAAGSGADTIVVPAGWTLTMTAPISDAANHVGPTATPIVTSPITIEANGARFVRLPGTESYRAFAVGSGGSLRLVEAHVKGFHAQGGRGAWGGGGGLGAGGAIYVHAGALTIDYSTFEGNGADGGRGSGTAPVGGGSGGGGGGGLGGTGGVGDHGGAGGGGSRGDGSDGFLSRGGSGGGRITSGTFSAPGAPCGGAGGDRLILAADGDDAACAGGGGGGGQQEDVFGVGNGGDGAYGGGGGGGGLEDGDGGHGGFGGGGGAGGQENPNAGTGGGSGGEGGFGAGGGSGRAGLVFGGPGAGGTFAGAGGSDSGGGGAALGGAIFGHEATVVIRNSTFTGNYVARGEAGGADADQGTDAGGAIFLVAGSLTVVHTTIAGNESTGEGAGLAVYKPTTGQATTLTLRNTIIAGNNGVRACFLRNGPTAIGSGNLIVPGGAFGAPLAPCPGIAITGDPALGSLQIEAPGRTPTMAIPLDSPATDAADPTPAFADDQRGAPRPLGAGYDVGAYEVGSFDTTAPAASPTQAPDANTNGWNNGVVTVTWNWTDAPGGSGIDAAHCTTSSSTSGEGATITLSATCADIAGNVGSASHTVKVDTTAPGGSPVALPAPNTNGWNNSAVTVTWNWTDTGGSGIETTNCATSSTTSGEGPAVMVSTSCSDLAGNAGTASRTANIDLTAPTVTCADPPRYVLGGAHAVDVTATVTDALSGPVAGGLAADVTAADVSTPGIKSKSLTGTDLAGNETTRSCAYVVQYAFLGFGEPVPQTQVKRGSRIPVKFRLGWASGAALTDAAAAALLAPVCLVRVTFDGDDRGCVAYDARTDTFQLDVKTSKSTSVGEHTIGIRVSAPDGSGVVNADSLTIGVRA